MKRMKISVIFLVLLLGLCSASAIFAQDPPPLAMLKGVANRTLAELERNRSRLSGNERLVYSIVRRTVMPHCDLNAMAQAVVGRSYWQQASSALQKQFINEFSFYVIRTYAGPLQSYKGETIKFYPIRGYTSGVNRVQILSDVIRHDGPPVRVSYRLYNARGRWIIYDFSVEGVSLVLNYRSQFAATLRSGGLTALVQEIRERNRGA